jgi:hypothetical protein
MGICHRNARDRAVVPSGTQERQRAGRIAPGSLLAPNKTIGLRFRRVGPMGWYTVDTSP